MRIIIATVILAVLSVSCSRDDSAGVAPDGGNPGTVVVYVFYDGQGLPDMRVELLELGVELKTNAEGLAEFQAPAGQYTVRAYDINSGGPPLYVDRAIVVEPDRTTRVEIFNCLPCV
jgi:hypothetical protein